MKSYLLVGASALVGFTLNTYIPLAITIKSYMPANALIMTLIDGIFIGLYAILFFWLLTLIF
jgi:H+/Cl- antiporter ClcA